MAETITLGGKPVVITQPLKQGHVLFYDEQAGESGAWVNIPSSAIEVSICGKVTSPDTSPRAGDVLRFNAEDNCWQPESE